jgi:hypothetical protein
MAVCVGGGGSDTAAFTTRAGEKYKMLIGNGIQSAFCYFWAKKVRQFFVSGRLLRQLLDNY